MKTTKLFGAACVALALVACKKSDKNIVNLSTTNTLTFEERAMTPGNYQDAFSDSHGFQEMDYVFNNDTVQYPPVYYWTTGWSISTMNDISNTFEVHTSANGEGAGASNTYIVGTYNAQIVTNNKKVKSLAINNAAYAVNSMQNGDAYAKKFGGVDGNDPDYFMLTIKTAEGDSINHYLADFTDADNTNDYIQTTWQTIDLSSLGNTQMLSFILRSSDTGSFGVNTPYFFCIDNITYEK